MRLSYLQVSLAILFIYACAISCNGDIGKDQRASNADPGKAVKKSDPRVDSILESALIQNAEELKGDSTNGLSWFRRGMMMEESGKNTQAMEAYRRAIRYAPEILDAKLRLANLLAQQPDPESLSLADEVLRVTEDPRSGSDARFIKGLYWLNKKDYTKAIQAYDTCIINDYSYVDAHIGKGMALYETKKYEEALKSFEKARNINSTFAEAYYQMGRCYEAMGVKDKAEDNYKKAEGLDSDYKF